MDYEGRPTCRHCGERILWTGFAWHHDNKHTVCNWHEGMEPTDHVASPEDWKTVK